MTDETGIKIYIPNPAYGRDDDWENKSAIIKEQLENEYQTPFKEIDIGTGAAQPAFVTTLLLENWPVVLTILFFQGKRIVDNLEAWLKLYEKLKTFFKHRPTLDGNGAAVIAFGAIVSVLGRPPGSFQLIGYRVDSALSQPFEETASDGTKIVGIEDEPKRVTDSTIHILQIEADDRHFKVFVYGTEVRVLEV